ncbi:uncharacterized protein LOC119773079 [Cyprinodon tularosa]|uniref:uncharacterized protein LOC119773079 n=1 Tax=Cyprinodon tularosa TaxID=77115 RepID=UPI0018E21138|nr:uncharacterized protein LOC119773079 [Cyprinodon tularosa]
MSDSKTTENMKWRLIFFIFICGLYGLCVMDRSVVYRAKENNNITIKWSIEMKTNFTLINMMCEMYTDTVKIVYETIRGSQKSADEQFAGRVHFDVDSPREAKIKLHLSRLKVEDSGHYCCYLNADYDDKAWRWRLQMTEQFVLNVTTAGNDPSSNTTGYPTTPDAEDPLRKSNRGQWGILISVFGLLLVVVVLYCIARTQR